MGKIKLFGLSGLVALILLACNIGATPTAAPLIASTSTVVVRVVDLTVQATNAGDPFNTVGQEIKYNYTVTNTGIVPLTGPVLVVNDKSTVACPAVSTVGNLDNNLDSMERVVCTSAYPITQTDLTNRTVTTVSTATISGFNSNQIATTITFATPVYTLQLTKTANPPAYNQVGQNITFMFVIQNISAAAIGPIQFMITDNKFGAPFRCGPDATTLAPQQTTSCTATYMITQADLTAGTVTNSATASGGGTNVSAPATTTITLSASPPGLTRGATIQHKVVKDEWMIQIARCYGASFNAVRDANRQIADPDVIDEGITLTIPNIGSNGTIYGPPCVEHHTVQSGDTWNSIAQRYNADVAVLQAANPKGMAVGTVLKIPRNSAGSTSSIPVTGPTPTVTSSTPFMPTPTFTPSPTAQAAQATRITFPVGGNSTTLTGSVPAEGTIRYVLSAVQGQTLAVSVIAPANEVAVTITGPNSVILNPLNTTFTWNVPLAVTGDYIIQIDGILGNASKPYTLNVSLYTP